METNNETVEQVCSVLYTYPKAEVCDGSVLTVLNNDKIADRILAAHKREIAELRECLREAVDYNCALCKSKGKACDVEGFCAEQRWRKALKGVKDGK